MAHTIAVHPGAVLLDELGERGISQAALAAHIGVLPKTINEICRGKRGISAEMAIKLSKALGRKPAVLAESPEQLGAQPGPADSGEGNQAVGSVSAGAVGAGATFNGGR